MEKHSSSQQEGVGKDLRQDLALCLVKFGEYLKKQALLLMRCFWEEGVIYTMSEYLNKSYLGGRKTRPGRKPQLAVLKKWQSLT